MNEILAGGLEQKKVLLLFLTGPRQYLEKAKWKYDFCENKTYEAK